MFRVRSTWLPVVILVLSLSTLAVELQPSRDVAEAERLCADLTDSYGIISAIESGLFATYQGKDKSAWQHLYQEKRGQFVNILNRVRVSGFSKADARHSSSCVATWKNSLSSSSLKCFRAGIMRTPSGALGMLGEIDVEDRHKELFLAFLPLWQAVNGENETDSPYRRLIRLAVSARTAHESEIDLVAHTMGVSTPEVERWLEQILEAWRQADANQRVQPWDFYYRGGQADRLLRAAIPKESFRSINDRYYLDLGADLERLGVLYDLDARPGKAPLAYTDYVTRGRLVQGQWRPTIVRVSSSYVTGGLGLLNELVHENGHAVHMVAIHVRPAFMDLGDSLFVEAFADVHSWNTYEPSWQQKYLGQAAPAAVSLRGLFSSVMLDVAWALFECRMLRTPTADPNAEWTDITSRYLRIVPHPELSWWAMRVQLVHRPGYMVNYGLGSLLTADIRELTREALGPFETGKAQWFSWTSDHLLRFGGGDRYLCPVETVSEATGFAASLVGPNQEDYPEPEERQIIVKSR